MQLLSSLLSLTILVALLPLSLFYFAKQPNSPSSLKGQKQQRSSNIAKEFSVQSMQFRSASQNASFCLGLGHGHARIIGSSAPLFWLTL